MQFQHTVTIDAPPVRVWDFLWDVERLAGCIPGCTEAKVIEPHIRYTALVSDRIGLLKLKMPLDLIVQSSTERERLHVLANGKDSALGSNVRVDIQANLEPRGAQTDLRLTVDAAVSGKIAGLGVGLFKRKFDDVMIQFGRQVKAAIEASPEPEAQG